MWTRHYPLAFAPHPSFLSGGRLSDVGFAVRRDTKLRPLFGRFLVLCSGAQKRSFGAGDHQSHRRQEGTDKGGGRV